MLEKQQFFARAYKVSPVVASVLLDNMLREAGLTWDIRTEDVLIMLSMRVYRTRYVGTEFDVWYRVGEVTLSGKIRIELAIGGDVLVVKLSTTIPEVLPLVPVWMVVGTGELREVMFEMEPPPELLMAGLILMAAAIEARRRAIIRHLVMQLGFMALNAVIIAVTVAMHAWIMTAFFIGFNCYMIVPRGWPKWVVVGGTLLAMYLLM
jgi:hypothetical protein